ncbi:MAG: hypothetical protein KAR65_03560, partial [Anaerolineales bacterium]|nr:hypothetical protein [Anaerolineales bacterium]
TNLPQPTRTPPPTATSVLVPTVAEDVDGTRSGDSLAIEVGELFSTSGSCAVCHTNLTDDSGDDVSIDSFWRATMMANAARDPYWQAAVSAEVLDLPDLADAIQEKCSTCHMPIAHTTAADMGETGVMFGEEGFLNPENDLYSFAMDGVSCTVCHQIREEGLGTEATFSGGFNIDSELRSPDRVIFGPFKTGDGLAKIMQSSSGYRPIQGLHLSRSALCASCHTLYTSYVDASGQIAGEFPEQVPFFEWYYSSYRRTQTCQDCHMPEADGGAKISSMSRILRSPFAVHSFVGGNAYMLGILDEFGDEIGVTASSENFDAAIERTLNQLQNNSATVEFEDVRLSGTRIIADVVVRNLAGHKFPAGFPSRRAWLHFTVLDGSGQTVFESGGFNEDGSIVGNDNDADPALSEQHYLAIVEPNQVQIYEAIMRDTEGEITTALLYAAGYRKDNRLLPDGFEKKSPYEDIAVRGGAMEDEDFQGGVDNIQYAVDIGSAAGPLTVKIELLYQTISFRWADNLREKDTYEIQRFLRYMDTVPNLPVVIASTSVEAGN